MVEMGKEQRCAQLCRVREKEKEDKGENNGVGLFGGGRGHGHVSMGMDVRGNNFRTEGGGRPGASLNK